MSAPNINWYTSNMGTGSGFFKEWISNLVKDNWNFMDTLFLERQYESWTVGFKTMFLAWLTVFTSTKICCILLVLVQFSYSVVSNFLWPLGLQHARLPCPSPPTWDYPNSIYWVSYAILPSHPLSPAFSPALTLSQHRGLFKWVSSSHQVAKVLEFPVQHQSFQWIFRTDFL